MQKILGIDVGGTNIKCGIVTTEGEIIHQVKFSTIELRRLPSFIEAFMTIVNDLLLDFPDVQLVGIGLPGTLNKERTHAIEVPNIPELNNVDLLNKLEYAFPNHHFVLENDANAAALGEYHFSKEECPKNLLFVTLGTGVGGAAIIDGKIFKGGDGNSMEIGHMMSEESRRLEELIGKKGIYSLVHQRLGFFQERTKLYGEEMINTRLMIELAQLGDPLVLEVYDKVATLLGENLVSLIRVLDIKDILVGGGISASFDFLSPKMLEVLNKNLTPYYTNKLVLKKASLGNEAGVLGAASLCFDLALVKVKAQGKNPF